MESLEFEEVRRAIEQVRNISDPMERVRMAHQAHLALSDLQTEFTQIRGEGIEYLRHRHEPKVTLKTIAEMLDMTVARVGQLAKPGPGPERALLAPKAGARTSVTVAVVRKQETEKNRSSVVGTTFDAALQIQDLAHRWDMKTKTEKVPENGHVDLNRDNLIVMIGPRITGLVAQAISADPAIKWRRDDSGHWYIVDTSAGAEYHSDFDDKSLSGTGTCYAHIGRIRRPDGEGSFLYLGGIHAPGTAGAVEILCDQIGELWKQARKGLWSAVVKTTANADESLISAEIVSPVYVHTKR